MKTFSSSEEAQVKALLGLPADGTKGAIDWPTLLANVQALFTLIWSIIVKFLPVLPVNPPTPPVVGK